MAQMVRVIECLTPFLIIVNYQNCFLPSDVVPFNFGFRINFNLNVSCSMPRFLGLSLCFKATRPTHVAFARLSRDSNCMSN